MSRAAGPVRYTSALILNLEQLRAEATNARHQDHDDFDHTVLNMADRDGNELRWTIQGNGKAEWSREVQ